MARPPIKPEDIRLREVLFEFKQVGNVMRVTSIDPVTGIEVVTVGDPAVDRRTLENIAIRRLKYVIAKHRNELAAKKQM